MEIKLHNSTVKLYNEDCLSGMRARLEPKSVDVIVTSPPYNIGVKYNQYDDSISRDDYLQWLHEWAQICTEILSDEGSLFLNIGSKPSDPWVPFEVATVMRDVFQLQNVIHWIKSIYIENDSYGDKTSLSVGHYKPINSKRYVNDTHEYIFHFTKTGRVELDRLAIGVPYKDKSNVSRWQGAKADKRCRGNTWYIPYKTIQNRNTERPHPASFPPELVANCIRLHGLEKSALVLDPFMGIGNTALACIDLKIDCVGFELDKEYFDQACQQAMTRITLFD